MLVNGEYNGNLPLGMNCSSNRRGERGQKVEKQSQRSEIVCRIERARHLFPHRPYAVIDSVANCWRVGKWKALLIINRDYGIRPSIDSYQTDRE